MSPRDSVKDILNSRNLAPHKKLGQNFLVHRQTAEKIVHLANITAADTVIELGVGFGALTLPIAEQAHKVIGIEIDSGIVRWHEENKELPDNVTLIHQDLLKTDFEKLAEQNGALLKIIANLPYSVSNPLLFKLIENRHSIQWAVLMLQKEVGERLVASVGTKDYGVLTVLLNSCASVKKLMELGPGQFHPKPKVDSVVVRITFNPLPAEVEQLPPFDRILFKKIVKSAFQQRRKTLLNALSANPLLPYDKDEVKAALTSAEIDSKIRAERLTTAEYVKLTNTFAELSQS
jgi:16S rRNA (adenine1518-N6/adenine1519-N6)-dimethyltransferase